MLRLALVLILFVFIARAFWRIVDGVIDGLAGKPRTSAPPDRTGAGIQMVRDPVCGTFLLPDRALTIIDGRQRLFFCSAACRDTYRTRTA
jgi:hypothetical protein